jgi:hypothetical protein
MHPEIKNTVVWMTGATLITGLALWQSQVALTQDRRAAEAAPPPPVRTRHAERTTPERPAGDPVANYLARQEKGLSDREIRWIVDDFKSAGLDLGLRAATREEYLAQRQAQDRWYRDALVDGWCLDAAQTAQVTLKLADLTDLAKADFIEALNAGPRAFQSNGQWFRFTSSELIERLVGFLRRITAEGSASLPWNLCKLPVDESADREVPGDSPLALSRKLLPRPEARGGVVEEARITALSQIHGLHPAQLKLLLLISPTTARDLETWLEAANH